MPTVTSDTVLVTTAVEAQPLLGAAVSSTPSEVVSTGQGTTTSWGSAFWPWGSALRMWGLADAPYSTTVTVADAIVTTGVDAQPLL